MLLQEAGHVDFKDARGPMGFTQRQSNGKFTRDEADAFIAELTDAAESGVDQDPRVRAGRGPVTAAERATAAQTRQVRSIGSEVLAAELQRRGWAVMAP